MNGAQTVDEQEALALAEEAPEEIRLAITAWAVRKLATHIVEPGTYRDMIYHRMGFRERTDSYRLLLPALDIMNRLHE
jgi:hypothetical protein